MPETGSGLRKRGGRRSPAVTVAALENNPGRLTSVEGVMPRRVKRGSAAEKTEGDGVLSLGVAASSRVRFLGLSLGEGSPLEVAVKWDGGRSRTK